MIIVLCLAYVAVADDPVPEPMKCNVGPNATALKLTNCTAEQGTKCFGPVLNILTGLSASAYGCGNCAKAAGCAACDSNNATACNVALTEGKTFMCYDYTYDNSSKVFAHKVNATTCHKLAKGSITCNSPGAKAEANYTSADAGCGPCAAGTLDKTECVECTKDGCNSAAALTAFLLPMIAIMYALF